MFLRRPLFAITFGIFVAGFSLVLSLPVEALCTNPSPLPSGFATPCPVFSLSANSVVQNGPLTLTATPQPGTDYILTTAYISQGTAWNAYTLAGNTATSNYSSALASLTLTSSQLSALSLGTHYTVVWDWLWDAASQCYKGPGLNQCNTGTWRVQTFTITATYAYSQATYYAYSQSAYYAYSQSAYYAYSQSAYTPGGCSGTCRYIRAGATGNGSGSDWANACLDFTGSCAPGSLIRGATYFVSGGNYGSRTFNTPVNGTAIITIKAPTAASHGTDTGWSSTYMGQASFQAPIQFLTSSWTFDGSYRGTATCQANPATCVPSTDWRTGYGFLINNNAGGGNSYSSRGILAGDGSYTTTVNNITLKYLEISGSHSTTGSIPDTCIQMQTGTPNAAQQNPYIGYSWCHDTGNAWWTIDGGNNFTLEYTWAQNNLTSATNHGEGVQLRCAGPASSNYILRYNYFENGAGTGVLATPCTTDINPSNWAIYGNVFFDNLAEGTSPTGYGAGNGAMALWNFLHWTGYLYIYNNTFSTLNPSGSGQCDIELDINNQGATMGNVAIENNVWYNCATQVSRSVCPSGGCTSFTVDHNSYFNTSTNDTSANFAQISSGNPFMNVTSAVNANDFRLNLDTAAWGLLAAPYNMDLRGVSRTSSRGAFQY